MMKSINDVAAAAGVSTATVSRVLSGKGYVSTTARKKVETAVENLGYRPNRVARSLREQQSRVIGLIISDIRNPFFSEICKSVEDVALAKGYSVLISNTNEDPERETRSIQLMFDENVAGILISPTLEGCKNFAAHTKLNLPMVVFDRKPPRLDIDSVLIDNVDSAFRLTRSLILAGHKHIGGIFGERSFTANERLKGFRAALEAADLEPSIIAKVNPMEVEGEHVMEKIFQQKKLDAVLCSSALLATGAYKAVRRLKKRIGFACFDDVAWAGFADPPVTVIRQPTEIIGATAAELLLKRIADPSRPVSDICLKGELIVRS
jgi:LacI family transcriptional regulator, fructose operon transcriptional repressor